MTVTPTPAPIQASGPHQYYTLEADFIPNLGSTKDQEPYIKEIYTYFEPPLDKRHRLRGVKTCSFYISIYILSLQLTKKSSNMIIYLLFDTILEQKLIHGGDL